MNKDQAGQVLLLLGAAVEAARVYGIGHAATVAAAGRMADGVAQLGATETLSLAFTEEGVVVGPWLVHDRRLAGSGLVGALAESGITLIRIHPGVACADVLELVGANTRATAWRSASGKIEFGAARSADRSGSPGDSSSASRATGPAAPLDPAEATRLVRESWERVLAGMDPGEDRFGAVAARLVSSLALADAGSLPMLQLKDHDEYTYVHAVNVGLVASALGQAAGLAGDVLHRITEAALLHDVGKSMIPATILSKSAKLDDAERRIMQRHPVIGAGMLAGVKGVSELAVIAAHEHHMRIDGGGYPRIRGGGPPALVSQLIQIADIFDALRSDRPYRAGMSNAESIELMSRDSGKAFDSRLFDLFCRRVVMRTAPSGAAATPAGAPMRRAA